MFNEDANLPPGAISADGGASTPAATEENGDQVAEAQETAPENIAADNAEAAKETAE